MEFFCFIKNSTIMNLKERFPLSLKLLGLNYGFTHNQFIAVMTLHRSEQIIKLAHKEWENEQDTTFDNSNWRWYLSYVSMKNEATFEHFNWLLNNATKKNISNNN